MKNTEMKDAMTSVKSRNRILILSFFFGLSIIKAGFCDSSTGQADLYKNRITEAPSCAATIAVLGDNTLYVKDLDNTVIRPVQTLGSDEWYGAMVSIFINDGLPKDDAIARAIAMWTRVQRATQVKPVEPFIFPNLINIFTRLSDHIRTIALTSRPAELAEATLRQLRSLDIDFSRRNPFGGAKQIEIRNPQFVDPILIAGGIVFIGPRNQKGRVLAFLLNPANGYNGYLPGFERVVFADDKLAHNRSVLEEVRRQLPHIDVYGFRIGSADKMVAAYNPEIAKRQWEEFERSGRLLTDEEALRPRAVATESPAAASTP